MWLLWRGCLLKIAFDLHTQTRTVMQIGHIWSIEELQTYLYTNGYYEGPIDGILGIETQKAWDRAYCDQCAAPIMRKAMGE